MVRGKGVGNSGRKGKGKKNLFKEKKRDKFKINNNVSRGTEIYYWFSFFGGRGVETGQTPVGEKI
jgi:hypothetical protein